MGELGRSVRGGPGEESALRAMLAVVVVAVVCGTVVAGAAVLLEPARAANRAAERDAMIRELVAGVPGVGELVDEAAGRLEARVVTLGSDEHEPLPDGATPEAVRGATVPIPEPLDVAGLGTRPEREVVYVLRRDGEPALFLLPLVGRGYGGEMRATLALAGDAETVVALRITDHSETPGLGAKVDAPAWQARWQGKSVHGPDGTVLLGVRTGDAPERPEHQVDGITGATRTGEGVTGMLRYWLGEHGFGPFLADFGSGGGDA